MDFITDLPQSRDPVSSVLHDAILVMVDKLTKYAHFIACSKTMDAVKLGHLVIDRLVRYHGLPVSFITDRDKLFTSTYWQTLVSTMGIKHKLSTAFHPQTDGQTERTNQTLEQYLRHFLNWSQDDWAARLPMAQLSANDSVHETTKYSPFFANFGKHPNVTLPSKINNNGFPVSNQAQNEAQRIQLVHDNAWRNIEHKNQNLIKSLHKDNKNGPQLKKGDKVYLLTKNLKTKRPSKKLDHVKVGPFLVAEQRGPLNYKLELPKDAGIHPVFHVSLLEPADPTTPLQETFHYYSQEEDVFEAEKIVQFDGSKYLVKWKDYDESENTWELPENLLTCLILLRQFHKNAAPGNRREWPNVDTSTQKKFLQSFGRNTRHRDNEQPQGRLRT